MPGSGATSAAKVVDFSIELIVLYSRLIVNNPVILSGPRLFSSYFIVVIKRKVYKERILIDYGMKRLEEVVAKVIKNLRTSGKLDGVRLSDSHRNTSGVDISQMEERELTEYISNLTHLAYFHGIEPAKESWHQINGLLRPMVNAGIIELGKFLPYVPGIDKNNLYQAIGIKIGKNTTIAPRVQFDYFHPELIEIGENCLIGDGVKIWTHDYGLNFFMIGRVKIGDSVYISSESVIGPSTTLGDNVRVGFGAFLFATNVPANASVEGRTRSRYAQ